MIRYKYPHPDVGHAKIHRNAIDARVLLQDRDMNTQRRTHSHHRSPPRHRLFFHQLDVVVGLVRPHVQFELLYASFQDGYMPAYSTTTAIRRDVWWGSGFLHERVQLPCVAPALLNELLVQVGEDLRLLKLLLGKLPMTREWCSARRSYTS